MNQRAVDGKDASGVGGVMGSLWQQAGMLLVLVVVFVACSLTVENFKNTYSGYNEECFSAVDLSAIGGVAAAVDSLADALIANMGSVRTMNSQGLGFSSGCRAHNVLHSFMV